MDVSKKEQEPVQGLSFSITEDSILGSLAKTFRFTWSDRSGDCIWGCRFIVKNSTCTRCGCGFDVNGENLASCRRWDCCRPYCPLEEMPPDKCASVPLGSLDPADQDIEFASFSIYLSNGCAIVTRNIRCSVCCERPEFCDCDPCQWIGNPEASNKKEKFQLRCQLIPIDCKKPNELRPETSKNQN